ncbi:hypothetical protein L6452_39578 [Arctium lappa]|uniref:Uncharacterized protein n=1 Tax=Arctium lappa TaxID=4217 RepID=A0ACB8XTU2_ARCLA|nr:hypothetical protein L6452_39578 [Arctium lappa]
MSLRTAAGASPQQPQPTTRNPSSSMHRYPRNLRLQEPISYKSKPVSYLIYPGDDHRANRSSLSMINDEESVDRDAWDFIKKVREKNLKDASDEMSKLSEFVLPPPPRIVRRSV